MVHFIAADEPIFRADRILRDSVKKFKPIEWETSNCRVNLSFGENCIKLPVKIQAELAKEINSVNYYPDIGKSNLKDALAEYTGFSAANIVAGNGSDELIDVIAKTFIDECDEAIIPVPSFPTYEKAVKLMGGKAVKIALNERFELNIDSILEAVNKKTKLIFIANPNNPTGNMLISKEEASKIAKSFNGLLVIDECYFEIANETMAELTNEFDNILILRSFSKTFGLAGLRVGYGIGSEQVIKYLEMVSTTINPFNVNCIAQKAAVFLLKNKKARKEILENFLMEKDLFESKLREITNLKIFPAKTTFSLLDVSGFGITSADFRERLKGKGILIKDSSIFEGLKEGYCRIGVPERKDFDFVIEAVKNILEGIE